MAIFCTIYYILSYIHTVPQIIKLLKMKSSNDYSIAMINIQLIAVISWSLYIFTSIQSIIVYIGTIIDLVLLIFVDYLIYKYYNFKKGGVKMIIHLDEDIFENIRLGTKNIEVRVNDEKRRKLKVGDKITFLKRPDEKESIDAIVEKLDYYENFEDLVSNYTMEELYSGKCSKIEFLSLLKRFYTDDEILKYGTVAIKFKIL